MIAWLTIASAAGAAALLVPTLPSPPVGVVSPRPARASPIDPRRALWSALAGMGVLVLVPGAVGAASAAVAAVVTWVVRSRAVPPDVRAARAAVSRDLPYVVALLAATLRSGAAPGEGIAQVCAALPGPASDRLAGATARLSLGLDPVQVWSALADDPQLGGLGRTLARAQETGAPVVAAVERLADDLARESRGETEDRARAVGVRAALPLGLCLLPAFVLIGIVPLVVALLVGLDL